MTCEWNDGLLRLAADRGLDFVQTARMLAMAHVSGGDAMIACFGRDACHILRHR
jgi:hypothetical protein